MRSSPNVVVWGISGGLEAALVPYHATRLLSFYSIHLRFALTPKAEGFVSKTALRAISGGLTYTEDIQFTSSSAPIHLDFAESDALFIYPATPRVISNCAYGVVCCPITRLFTLFEPDRIILTPFFHEKVNINIFRDAFLKLSELGVRLLIPPFGGWKQSPWPVAEGALTELLKITPCKSRVAEVRSSLRAVRDTNSRQRMTTAKIDRPQSSGVASDVLERTVRFQQEKANFCGPACSEMWLSRLSVPVAQGEAFDEIRKLMVELDSWASDPAGLSKYIHGKDTLSSGLPFDCVSFDSADDAILELVRCIEFAHCPAICLVFSGGHWLVVDGVRFEQLDTGVRTVLGFYIENPWFGTDGFEFITNDDFRKAYLLPDKWGKRWLGKYVVLVPIFQSKYRPSNLHVSFVPQPESTSLGSPGSGVAAAQQYGFNNVSVVGGGAGVFLSPINVVDEHLKDIYTIFPLDGSKEPLFQNYIYVAVNLTGSLLAISPMSFAIPVADDGQCSEALKMRYPGVSATLTQHFIWKSCERLRSRFDICRLVVVDGRSMYLFSDWLLLPSLDDFIIGA